MRIRSNFIFLLLIFILSACAGNATSVDGIDLSNVYTAAASTIAAQQNVSAPTITSTAFPTPTMFSLPTSVPLTPTAQSAISASYSSASTANGCNNSIFISDVTITDGTVLAPGQSFTKTWEFQNNGTCAWGEDYLLTFMSGNDMDGEDTEIAQEVAIGDSGDISVSLIAPSTEGTYTGYWRLADEDGNAFGQSVYVMIVVSDDAATTTPTPTSTTEATEVEATSTIVPTATFTATPIPTEAPATESTETAS